MAADRPPVGRQVARHDADALGRDIFGEQLADPHGDLPYLGLRSRRREAERRCRSWRRRRGRASRGGRRGQPGARREGLRQPLGERGLLGAGPRRVGRAVEDEPGAGALQQAGEEIGGDAGGVGEAVDPEGAGGEGGVGVGREVLAGAAQEVRGAADPQPLGGAVDAGRDAHQGARPLDRGARGGAGPQLGERLLGGVGVRGGEPGVEQIADGAGDGAVAVGEAVERLGELPLELGEALGEEVEHRGARRRRLAGARQHLAGEAVESLHDDPGGRAAAPRHERRGDVLAEAPRRHDDADRKREEGGVARRRVEKGADAVEEQRLGGARAARHDDRRFRSGGRSGGPGVEQRELQRHGGRIPRGPGAPAAGGGSTGRRSRHSKE